MREKKEVAAEKKPLQSAVRRVLNSKIPDRSQDLEEMLQSGGMGLSNKNAVALAMVLEAMKGNKSCAEWLREAAGEKGVEKRSDNSQNSGGAVVFISGEEEIKE